MSTVEIDLMRYERQCDIDCAREEAIEKEKHRLMDGEMNPYDGENFCEALFYAPLEAKQEIDQILKQPSPDTDTLGNLVYNICFDYWDAEAETKAEDIVDGVYDD